jgi:regulator of sirC expression with transglutaminase-like and TPR domain
MHVESVAWIAERKNVLSVFFWMLTLCLYVYYTEKPAVKRYLAALFAFALALMSKPMAVTLPVMMILLDYWPLKRLEPQKSIMDMIRRQLKEKGPFFILSAVLIIVTLNIPHERDLRQLPLGLSLANASISSITYLAKILWPQNMAVFYPFPDPIPLRQVFTAVLLLITITAAVIFATKRFPFLFVGWFWYAVTILPVLGIIHIADFAMADRYTYLPSIGIAVMMAWGIPLLFQSRKTRGKILFPAAIVFLAAISVITWRQCGTWKDSTNLWMHALRVTKNNALAYNNLGYTLFNEGKVKESIECYNRSLGITKGDASAFNKRGIAYASLGQHQQAVSDFSEAIRLKPYYAPAFYNRGNAYKELGQYEKALNDFDDTIRLSPYYAQAYNRRADIYLKTGKPEMACPDAQKACELGDCRLLKFVQERKYCR